MAQYGTAKYGSSVFGSGLEHPYAGTPGKIMWMVQIDWDNDGIFGGSIESQRLINVKIVRGRTRRMNENADAQLHPEHERIEIRIFDPGGVLDSFNVSSPLYQHAIASGLILRVLMVSTSFKGGIKPVFVGTLTNLEYDSQAKTAIISGDGLSHYLQIGNAAIMYSPCQPIPGYDSYFHWDGSTPVPFNYWKGRPDGLTLRACTEIILSQANWALGAFYGLSVYNTEQPEYFYLVGESAWQTLKSLADGFAARLFFLRDGSLFMMDRLDPLGSGVRTPPGRALEKFGLGRDTPISSLRNRAEISIWSQYVPIFSDIYLSYTPIWNHDGPIEVPASTTKYLLIKYPEGSFANGVSGMASGSPGKPIQASFADANQGYVANSKIDLSGIDMGQSGTAEAGFWMVHPPTAGGGADPLANQKFCTVKLQNLSSTLTAYYFNLGVVALGLIETGKTMLIVEDTPSQVLNGLRSMQVTSRWIQDENMAAGVGQSYLDALSSRENASVAALTYQWSGDTLYTNLRDYDLGTVVDFDSAGSPTALLNHGLWGRRLIVGQELSWLSPDGQEAQVKLTFERMTPGTVVAGATSYNACLNANTVSWDHTVEPGNNRIMVLTLSKRAFTSAAITTVTYDGVPMTKLTQANLGTGGFAQVEIWYLLNPAVGLKYITINLSGPDSMQFGCTNFKNVDQSRPFGTPVLASGLMGPASLTVPASPNEYVLDVVGFCHINTKPVAHSGQTQLWNISADNNLKGAASCKPGAGLTVLGWEDVNNPWVQMGVTIRGV